MTVDVNQIISNDTDVEKNCLDSTDRSKKLLEQFFS